MTLYLRYYRLRIVMLYMTPVLLLSYIPQNISRRAFYIQYRAIWCGIMTVGYPGTSGMYSLLPSSPICRCSMGQCEPGGANSHGLRPKHAFTGLSHNTKFEWRWEWDEWNKSLNIYIRSCCCLVFIYKLRHHMRLLTDHEQEIELTCNIFLFGNVSRFC